MDNEYIIVITAAPLEDEARQLAARLIEQRLAACVQAEKVESIFHWQGAVETADETRLMIKTCADLFSQVEKLIRAELSEETPEIISIPILQGSPDYLSWLASETSDAQ